VVFRQCRTRNCFHQNLRLFDPKYDRATLNIMSTANETAYTNTNGLYPGVRKLCWVGLDGFPRRLACPSREVSKGIGSKINVLCFRFAKGFACTNCLSTGISRQLNDVPFSSDWRAVSSSLCSSKRLANFNMSCARAEPGRFRPQVVLKAALAALTAISTSADEPNDT
jgi:hypothetical protein